MSQEVENGSIVASDDPDRIDLAALHTFLEKSYWAQDIPFSVVEDAIRNSLVIGLYDNDNMIGFARAVTDYATFAYVGDVYVLEEWRGRGLGIWVTRCLIEHPRMQGLRRWLLATKDAHGVYAKLGFKPLADPSSLMTIHDPDIYKR